MDVRLIEQEAVAERAQMPQTLDHDIDEAIVLPASVLDPPQLDVILFLFHLRQIYSLLCLGLVVVGRIFLLFQ